MASMTKRVCVTADDRLYADIVFTYSETSTDVVSNSSVVSWSVSATQVSSSTIAFSGTNRSDACDILCYIDGKCVCTHAFSLMSYAANNTWSTSGTCTVTHNAEGAKTASISLQIDRGSGNYTNDPWVYGSASGSDSLKLTQINRVSTISTGVLTVGSGAKIDIDSHSSAFIHVLSYFCGSTTGVIATDVTEPSVPWVVPESLASEYPKATSGTVTLRCDTYLNGELVGGTSIHPKFSIPEIVIPTISSLDAVPVNPTAISSWGIFVQGVSKASVSINGAAGIYGSTITGYSIKGGGYSSTQNTLETGVLTSTGQITFTSTVTDSRNRTSNPKTAAIIVVPYASPVVTNFSSQRCTADGSEADEGTCILGNVTFSFSSAQDHNSVTTSVRYRKQGTTSWTDAGTSFTSGQNFVFGNAEISIESTYEIEYIIQDALNTVTIPDIVSTASVLLDFKAGGTGIAVGKVSEKENAFEVNPKWTAWFHDKEIETLITDLIEQSTISILSKSWPVGSIFTSTVSTDPSVLLGFGTWQAYGAGRVLVGVGHGEDVSGYTADYTAGAIGGEYKHKYTIDEMPKHWHYYDKTHQAYCWSWGGTGKTKYIPAAVADGNGSGNQLNTLYGQWYGTDWEGNSTAASLVQPYIAVYFWKRTA